MSINKTGPKQHESDIDMGDALDALLATRAQSQSDLPGLAGQVMSGIEARERAKAWCAQHGSLLSRGRNGWPRQDASPGARALTAFGWLIETASGSLGRLFGNSPLAAAAGGAIGGWLIGAYLLPAPALSLPAWIEACFPAAWQAQVPQVVLLSAALAATGAIACAAASRWQQLREFYF